MRFHPIASVADLLHADAQIVVAEFLRVRDAVTHAFRDEAERGRYLALVRAWGLFAHHDRFSAAIGEDALSRPAGQPIKPVCRECGSDELARDASARWDIEAQDWTASGVYDSTSCDACEAESDTLCRWVPVEPAAPLSADPASAVLS